MWPLKSDQSSYLPVESESGSEFKCEKQRNRRARIISVNISVFTVVFIVAICLTLGFASGAGLVWRNRLTTNFRATQTKCSSLRIRREWRSLSISEKEEYITSVKCLTTKQSKLSKKAGDSLYNDFPYLHATIGGYSHGAAAFLAWHRLFLHNYETELKNSCGYTGSLVYWDWSLDWEYLSISPVFSNITGFGGNGDANAPKSVSDGHCVTDGPFANLQLPLYEGDDHAHCLSRGFKFDQKIIHGKISGEYVRPSVVEEILSLPDYESFFLALERHPHNAIPTGIRGDFMGFTAPNDPIFFLHHSQLDRLWWKWQKQNPVIRLSEYTGKSRNGSVEMAAMSDILPMGGLAPDMTVSTVMDTESEFLCYTY
ncbi:hypothetical protein B0O99DRAFT_571195 [Bisporella sp. PMI_857]|nr:hypothetical protein B0O99DRAFT_571195 [Bisporella sp. PMI_857]